MHMAQTTKHCMDAVMGVMPQLVEDAKSRERSVVLLCEQLDQTQVGAQILLKAIDDVTQGPISGFQEQIDSLLQKMRDEYAKDVENQLGNITIIESFRKEVKNINVATQEEAVEVFKTLADRLRLLQNPHHDPTDTRSLEDRLAALKRDD